MKEPSRFCLFFLIFLFYLIFPDFSSLFQFSPYFSWFLTIFSLSRRALLLPLAAILATPLFPLRSYVAHLAQCQPELWRKSFHKEKRKRFSIWCKMIKCSIAIRKKKPRRALLRPLKWLQSRGFWGCCFPGPCWGFTLDPRLKSSCVSCAKSELTQLFKYKQHQNL